MSADITIPVSWLVAASVLIFIAYAAVVIVAVWNQDRRQKPRSSRHR